MADIQTFVDESIRYSFDELFEVAPVREEHREDIKNVLMQELSRHIYSIEPWLIQYLADVDLTIKKSDNWIWIDALMEAAFFDHSFKQQIPLPHGYFIYAGGIMTAEQMNAEFDRRRRHAERIRDIHENERDDIISFVTNSDGPVYVNTVMQHFGKADYEERDAYRSVVWSLISDNVLTLGNKLTLSAGKAINV